MFGYFGRTYGKSYFIGTFKPDFKTVLKTKHDNNQTVKRKVIDVAVSLRKTLTGHEINLLVQKCMKHGSVEVYG